MNLARTLGLSIVGWLWCSFPAQARAPEAPADYSNKLVTFDEVLEEIRTAQDSGAWKKDAWKPHATKTWLNHLLAEIKRATKREKLKLPVDFDKVKPIDLAANANRLLGTQTGCLHVLKDGKLSIVRQSIILADGSVELSMAEDCIIIARGAVTLSSSHRNWIVAGQFASISYDRANGARLAPAIVGPNGIVPPPAPAADATEGSVILCGGTLDISSAYGTICCGLDRLVTSYTDANTILLNSPRREISTSARCATVDDAQIPFHRKAAANPLEDKLSVTQVVPGTAGLVVLERNGVEYVLRPQAAITDERGQPLPELANWKLDVLARNYALFAQGRHYAGFYVKR